MNIFARFINSFEKPPVSKTSKEEWRKHSGVQAEMVEKQEKAEEERKIEQSKAEAEMKKKQEKEWEEHFGDSARILKEGEEKITEPPKVSGGEPLQKSEFAPGWAEQRRKIVEHEKNVLREFAGLPAEPKKEAKEVGEESTKTALETKEGEKFSIERLTNPEDPRVNKVQEMLEKYFRSEEVDPIEVLKQAMTGTMATGEKVPSYLIHVAENSKGEIEGLQTGAVCETVDAKGNISKKSGVSLGFYTVVPPEMRKKGIFKNLFKAYEKAAGKDAEERGLRINGSMGEAHDEVEPVFNNQGMKRAYVKASGVFFELPYQCPPVDWNTETGKPEEGAGTMSEHLMLKLTSGKNKVSGKQIMEMVRGMYNYNNYREEEYFKSEKAYKDHTKFVKRIEQNLTDFVAGKTVYLLDAKEREAMKKKGVQFSEQELKESLLVDKGEESVVKKEPEAGDEKRRLTDEELKGKTKKEFQELRNKAGYEWASVYLRYKEVLDGNPDIIKARRAEEKAQGTEEWLSVHEAARKIEGEVISKNPEIAKLEKEYGEINDYMMRIDRMV
ncbi:MAG: hypothetical protein Q7R84_02295 [bacterium]|nr:hypothetical protein [bacterium]